MLPVIIEFHDQGDGLATEMAFDVAPVRIGRNPLNDVHIDRSFVSQWHALIEFDATSGRFQDLSSTNGTIHDGKRLGREAVEIPNQGALELTIGSVQLRISRGPAEALLREADRSAGQTSKRLSALAAALGTDDDAHAVATDTALLTADPPLVSRAAARLEPLYGRYRDAWAEFQRALDHEALAMTPALRSALLERLQAAMPAVAGEESFQALLRASAGDGGRPVSASDTALRGLQKFVELYTPHAPLPTDPEEVRLTIVTIVRVLEYLTKAFVELRKGQEEFAAEMAVRTIRHTSPLSGARSPEEVMSYLLDWKRTNPQRIKELMASIADIMIHQVALLSGMMEGVRGLLRKLSPEAIEAELAKQPSRLGPLPIPRWLRSKSRAAWRRYKALHDGLGEESALSAVLFGREFARAYEAIGGPPQPKIAATVMFQRSLPERRRG